MLLEKLLVDQFVKNLSTFYRIREFNSVIHKRLLLDPMPSQMARLLPITSYFFNVHFNIILPFKLTSPKWTLPFRFSN